MHSDIPCKFKPTSKRNGLLIAVLQGHLRIAVGYMQYYYAMEDYVMARKKQGAKWNWSTYRPGPIIGYSLGCIHYQPLPCACT